MHFELGTYFVVTGGYCERSGLVDQTRKALLFVSDDGVNFRQATPYEVAEFASRHPVLVNSR